MSFLELYNEELFDLLSPGEDSGNRLRIFEDSARKARRTLTICNVHACHVVCVCRVLL